MAERFSSGFIKAMMGSGSLPWNAFTAGRDISASSNGVIEVKTGVNLTTLGFTAGGRLGVYDQVGCVGGMFLIISTVSATGITIAGSMLTSAFVAGSGTALIQIKPGRIMDILKGCFIRIYSGSQPATADAAETGTLLATLSASGNTATAYDETNGLHYTSASASAEKIDKTAGETWQGTAVATGTAGWFRIYDNTMTTGASTTAIRADGAIATSGAELNLSSTAITSGATITVDELPIYVRKT